MRIATSTLCLFLAFLFGCSRGSPPTSSTPLSFYVVSEEKVEGGRFIDTPNFPKLGYIGATPDLVVARLGAVVSDVSRQKDVMVDKNGKQTGLPLRTHPALTIRMRADDAKKFTALTKKAVGKRVLMMQGETPLIAPRVESPIATQSLILTLGDKTDNKKIEDELKKLVW